MQVGGLRVRKRYTFVEEIMEEQGVEITRPVKKGAAAAVIKNPYAGRYEADLHLLIDAGEELGGFLASLARTAINISGELVESYGKAVIVGVDGELEHGHAILHPKFGKTFRAECGGEDICKAIIPSSVKVGSAGTSIDVPLHYKRAAFVRSHYDAIEVKVPDAPLPDELVVIAAVSYGGRPLPRIGGLRKEEVRGEDGLR
ncbi:MAG: amino acid synthesis family protein [Nitrososphaerota archaeon]